MTLSKDSGEKREGRSPAKRGSRPVEGSTLSSTLGGVLKLEGDLYVDLVASDVAVLDHDVHVLYPATLYAPERLGSSGYGLVDSILEACSETALSSVTLAMLIRLCLLKPLLPIQ